MTPSVKMPPLPLRRIARVLAVLAIALAAGHLVQTLAARKPTHQAQAAAKTPVKIVQLSAGSDDAGLVAPLLVQPPAASVAPLPIAAPAAPICATALDLRQQPGAMIGVMLTATCHDGERVVLRHAGLALTAKTGMDGKLALSVPALSTAGDVEILFADGSKVASTIAMPEALLLRRFGVQWRGAEAFVIHGFQNGADYGQAGDISPANRGVVVASTGGFLSLVGDASVTNPLMAQIYTYPMDPTATADVVVEAAVTTATCGHDLLGETLMSVRGVATATDLTLAMPDCSGVGDFLVLKNLATDMKIAAN